MSNRTKSTTAGVDMHRRWTLVNDKRGLVERLADLYGFKLEAQKIAAAAAAKKQAEAAAAKKQAEAEAEAAAAKKQAEAAAAKKKAEAEAAAAAAAKKRAEAIAQLELQNANKQKQPETSPPSRKTVTAEVARINAVQTDAGNRTQQQNKARDDRAEKRIKLTVNANAAYYNNDENSWWSNAPPSCKSIQDNDTCCGRLDCTLKQDGVCTRRKNANKNYKSRGDDAWCTPVTADETAEGKLSQPRKERFVKPPKRVRTQLFPDQQQQQPSATATTATTTQLSVPQQCIAWLKQTLNL